MDGRRTRERAAAIRSRASSSKAGGNERAHLRRPVGDLHPMVSWRISTAGAQRVTDLTPQDIEANLDDYLGDRDGHARYSSFDYCFNYFRSFQREGRLAELTSRDMLEMSCLQLGFYLASWGMFRGKSQLIRRSMKHYVSVLEAVISADARVWTLDVGSMTTKASN